MFFFLIFSLLIELLSFSFIYFFFNKSAPWQEASNRRMFFEKYALENGFDPLVPHNWYLQSREKIRSLKVHSPSLSLFIIYFIFTSLIFLLIYCLQGARQVLYYHNNNISNALENLFPELHFPQLYAPSPSPPLPLPLSISPSPPLPLPLLLHQQI